MLACLAAGLLSAAPGKATLTEGKTSMLTYDFSDPNPVANPNQNQYPYFNREEQGMEDRRHGERLGECHSVP